MVIDLHQIEDPEIKEFLEALNFDKNKNQQKGDKEQILAAFYAKYKNFINDNKWLIDILEKSYKKDNSENIRNTQAKLIIETIKKYIHRKITVDQSDISFKLNLANTILNFFDNYLHSIIFHKLQFKSILKKKDSENKQTFLENLLNSQKYNSDARFSLIEKFFEKIDKEIANPEENIFQVNQDISNCHQIARRVVNEGFIEYRIKINQELFLNSEFIKTSLLSKYGFVFHYGNKITENNLEYFWNKEIPHRLFECMSIYCLLELDLKSYASFSHILKSEYFVYFKAFFWQLEILRTGEEGEVKEGFEMKEIAKIFQEIQISNWRFNSEDQSFINDSDIQNILFLMQFMNLDQKVFNEKTAIEIVESLRDENRYPDQYPKINLSENDAQNQNSQGFQNAVKSFMSKTAKDVIKESVVLQKLVANHEKNPKKFKEKLIDAIYGDQSLVKKEPNDEFWTVQKDKNGKSIKVIDKILNNESNEYSELHWFFDEMVAKLISIIKDKNTSLILNSAEKINSKEETIALV